MSICSAATSGHELARNSEGATYKEGDQDVSHVSCAARRHLEVCQRRVDVACQLYVDFSTERANGADAGPEARMRTVMMSRSSCALSSSLIFLEDQPWCLGAIENGSAV